MGSQSLEHACTLPAQPSGKHLDPSWGRGNHCPPVGGQVSCQIWSLASCDLVIWGLGSLSESEKVWGGGEKSLAVSNTNQFISQSINMSIYQTFTMHRGLALNSRGSCQGVYVRLASLFPRSPWFAHVGDLCPGLGLTAEKGWARPAGGGKVGYKACQGLRDREWRADSSCGLESLWTTPLTRSALLLRLFAFCRGAQPAPLCPLEVVSDISSP